MLQEWLDRFRESLLDIPDEVPSVHVYARAALLALITWYGVKLASMDIPSWEMAGALFQCALPLVVGGVLLLKNRDPFGAAVMLWWSGVAVMDTAPYVYDAFQPQHILLTGRTGDTGAHDFIDVLGDLGLLMKAQAVGRGVHAFGAVVMVFALAWGAAVVWRQYARRAAGRTRTP